MWVLAELRGDLEEQKISLVEEMNTVTGSGGSSELLIKKFNWNFVD